jgi:hypothetical protein
MARRTANWPKNYRPTPGNFGAQFQTLSRAIGTNGITLTGTATNTVWVPVPRCAAFSVVDAAVQGPTAAAGSGAITSILYKRLAGTSTDVALTAAQDLTTMATNNVEDTITASDINRACVVGDTLHFDVVAAGTVGTVPELLLIVELAITTP